MTLWIDRRQELQFDAPATHALVIGTSSYLHLPGGVQPAPASVETFGLQQVSTPCAGAFAFARWLRDAYHNPKAPLATARLLLAPSPEELGADPELAAAACDIELPTRANVEAALFDWFDGCEDDPDGVAILYASGHGIQVTREDALILLHDFASTRNVINNSLDIGSVYHAMAGGRVPRRQWYFVDACRSSPDELRNWRSLGKGIGLPVSSSGADNRCAPIFFSASPDMPAYGQRGKGTIFSQALVECLASAGAERGPDDQGRWHISIYSLQSALSHRVQQIAAAVGCWQETVAGGQFSPGILHYFNTPPIVPFTLVLDPEHACIYTLADLWNDERSSAVFENQCFEEARLKRLVPAGLYSLDVRIRPPTAPFRDRQGLPCAVNPGPGYSRTIKVV
jgi:hypothetical protein